MKEITSRSRERLSGCLTRGPYELWAVLFIFVPLIFTAYYAFTDDNFTFTTANIAKFFTTTSAVGDGTVHTYILILWRSLKLAIISTIVCLFLGYPLAYIIARASSKAQKLMMTFIMIPMWMNFLIRTYAWMTILQDTGLLNRLLALLHLGQVHIIGTETAVIIGMVYDYIPYMILPLYSVMAKMDVRLLEAARDLGCSGFGVLRRVIFPISIPGVVNGITMVLIPSISTFYISQKLGDGKFYLIGDAIEGQYTANNLHFAAAIAFVLMVILLACMAVVRQLVNRRSAGGAK